jgi:uncharacterized protein YggU (UPF0235/DUF167 family)
MNMHIQKVISYKNAWQTALDQNKNELIEVVDAFDEYFNSIPPQQAPDHTSPRTSWEMALQSRGWEFSDRFPLASDGRRIPMGNMGPQKNGVGVQIAFSTMDTLSRWIFQQSALAVRHGLFKLPILCVPTSELMRRTIPDRHSIRLNSVENYLRQLELLSPLSHQFPFLILGISDHAAATGPEIIEISSDSVPEKPAKMVDRCIKFPPEYHQAGVGILNFFSTYLLERYPEEDASISIEQHGLNVRLTIETASGESEVVEKALHEFELIVSGKEEPEKFTSNDKLILEIRSEMRIAKSRVEFQQDLIGIKDKQIDRLMSIIGNGLSNPAPIAIDFRPTICNTSNIIVNRDISAALGNIAELLSMVPNSSPENLMLTEVAGSLEVIEAESDAAKVRKSPAMSKFRRVMDKVLDAGDETNVALTKIENGIGVAKDLAKKYNSIAEWCGLPVIPSVLIQ